MKSLIGAVALLLTMVSPVWANDDDVAGVTAAVYDYFEGQGERSLERLERAFRSEAQMIGYALTMRGMIRS